jgi:hypothetical protein
MIYISKILFTTIIEIFVVTSNAQFSSLSAGKTESLQNLRSSFPLKMCVEGVEKKKLFWSDIEVSSGDASAATNNKKQKTGGEVGLNCCLLFTVSFLDLNYY